MWVLSFLVSSYSISIYPTIYPIKHPTWSNTHPTQETTNKLEARCNAISKNLIALTSLYVQVGIHNKLFKAIKTCMRTFCILKISIPKHSWEHPKPWRLSWNPEGCGTGGRYEVHAGLGGGRPLKTLGSSPGIPKGGAKAVWVLGGEGAGRVGWVLSWCSCFATHAQCLLETMEVPSGWFLSIKKTLSLN